ncbi:MAG: hypothetical protein ACLFOY_13380 [Desulfatibacillaceae bacterium]
MKKGIPAVAIEAPMRLPLAATAGVLAGKAPLPDNTIRIQGGRL